MAEHSPGARQDRERGSARLASPTAYDRWFDTGWGRYAFTVEQPPFQRPALPSPAGRWTPAAAPAGSPPPLSAAQPNSPAWTSTRPRLTVAAQRVRAPGAAANAGGLPFRDAAFDVTIAVTVCEFAASPAALVAELARVTRPGGRVVIGALNRRSAWALARCRAAAPAAPGRPPGSSPAASCAPSARATAG